MGTGFKTFPKLYVTMYMYMYWSNTMLYLIDFLGGMWTTSGDATTSLLARQLSQPGSSNVTLEGGGGTGGLAHSLFPIENYDLIYKRWEDDIIWDSEAVTHIPKPSVALLDPNDPNIILGIPEEPVAPNSLDKDGKKVCVDKDIYVTFTLNCNILFLLAFLLSPFFFPLFLLYLPLSLLPPFSLPCVHTGSGEVFVTFFNSCRMPRRRQSFS